jgi:hypothetical protein
MRKNMHELTADDLMGVAGGILPFLVIGLGRGGILVGIESAAVGDPNIIEQAKQMVK